VSRHSSGPGEEEPSDDEYDDEIARLYVKEGARLRGHLMKKGAPLQLAEDIVQDSFLATRLRWHAVRTYEKPIAYVYRVAENRLRKLLGRERTEPHADPQAMGRPGEYATQPDHETRLLVDEAISCLAPQVARVVRLHYLADLKVTEVARRMDISENTVKGYLRAAREHLRDLLAAWPGEERRS
jgi:RNA polymerase sigma factor (sigma-70 family)